MLHNRWSVVPVKTSNSLLLKLIAVFDRSVERSTVCLSFYSDNG